VPATRHHSGRSAAGQQLLAWAGIGRKVFQAQRVTFLDCAQFGRWFCANIDVIMKNTFILAMVVVLLALCGCASWGSGKGSKQVGSVVDYLYPNAKEPPALKSGVTYLRPPVRVGVAFVPGSGLASSLPETEKIKLLERVKASFSKHEFIGNIEIIPTTYLQPKGGFANLEQVARMFNVEVVALLSYDQVQFNDTNVLSVLYWTIVGAYIIHGDQYDVQTLVDASVFDVRTNKLLFRAPGTSQVKGSASMAGFSERARAARTEGYNKAVDDLIPKLQTELDSFKERIKTDVAFKVESKPGYSGGGSVDGLMLALAGLLAAFGYAKRRTP
jgi:rhombotail lipoprotein